MYVTYIRLWVYNVTKRLKIWNRTLRLFDVKMNFWFEVVLNLILKRSFYLLIQRCGVTFTSMMITKSCVTIKTKITDSRYTLYITFFLFFLNTRNWLLSKWFSCAIVSRFHWKCKYIRSLIVTDSFFFSKTIKRGDLLDEKWRLYVFFR